MSPLRLFTSESVTEGHPDKVCDSISDTVLDDLLAVDPTARAAIETMVATGFVHVAGEIRASFMPDVERLVRETVRRIGYTDWSEGFAADEVRVEVSLGAQSADIAMGVDAAMESRDGDADALNALGAGDQGIMFGFATRETPQLMPLPIWLAHRLAERLAQVRRDGTLPWLRPDGKTQVTIGYDGHVPRTVDTVVLSAQHAPGIAQADLRAAVTEHVIAPVLAGAPLASADARLLINPTGRFEVGGPVGDAGLTGRKIIVDTYGGASRHGGGAFSGKDPTKVDRSAAYALRWVAKNAVAAGLADRLEVQVAYAIGKAEPVGLYVETFGSGLVDDATIIEAIREVFDLRPAAIIRDLDLRRPIYAATAAYGHFGRELPDFTWERLDRVDALRVAAGI